MSNFAPAPHNPDGRVFASYPMPAKIDLVNERPRRESLVERQLESKIGSAAPPRIEVTEQKSPDCMTYPPQYQYQRQPSPTFEQQTYSMCSQQAHQSNQQQQQQKPLYHQEQQQMNQSTNNRQHQQAKMQTTNFNETIKARIGNNAAILASELAEKEAKLMAEINALQQRPYSPFQTPAKIDLQSEQRIVQQQYQNAPSPRPFSQASSTKSTSADLMDKEAKLMQEIEEMERKPFNPQTMVVEREQWFEYPSNRPGDRHLTDSKRRVKDFCALPSHMYGQDKHIHEEHQLSAGRPSSAAGSVHTTIIRSPKREVDNKSPLPFAFDNFTTKGIRGNIASVGAIEPDRPRAPIYPIMKRTPSPNVA